MSLPDRFMTPTTILWNCTPVVASTPLCNVILVLLLLLPVPAFVALLLVWKGRNHQVVTQTQPRLRCIWSTQRRDLVSDLVLLSFYVALGFDHASAPALQSQHRRRTLLLQFLISSRILALVVQRAEHSPVVEHFFTIRLHRSLHYPRLPQ